MQLSYAVQPEPRSVRRAYISHYVVLLLRKDARENIRNALGRTLREIADHLGDLAKLAYAEALKDINVLT